MRDETQSTTPVDVVLIGRNEGARLIVALQALQGVARQVVYVDSGSTDNSVAEAKKAGAEVVALDMSIPFTAARARNAGFDALRDPQHVQFIDGDCALVPGYLAKASAFLDEHPKVGLVTGWRGEIDRDASLYNQIIDWEWRRPSGEITATCGDMMVRAEIWREIGGMNPNVICAEDDEVCIRIRKAGWTLWRIPEEMTRHDAAMLRFRQWWTRSVRAGHGLAQVSAMHPGYFKRERQRAWVYGLALPLLALIGLFASLWITAAVLLIYLVNYLRTARGLLREGIAPAQAWPHAGLLSLSKLPNLIGMFWYHIRRLRGAQMQIIEYK